jgi:hypothetical protein
MTSYHELFGVFQRLHHAPDLARLRHRPGDREAHSPAS